VIDRIRSLLGQSRPRPGRSEGPPVQPEWVIAGLGNPGPKYARSRHNAGFLCLDRIADRFGLRFDRVRHSADLAAGTIADHPVWLIKPRTFMNLSGQAVGPMLRSAGLGPDRLIVIYDELDLGLGTTRLRKGGSAGGHNGMKSIIQSLAGSEFPRLRVGIGRPTPGREVIDYVLDEFGPDEWPVFERVRDRVAEAIPVALEEGLDAAMSRFNRRD
jgi:PTH1 family peptidyl-tRNA hydrolase